MAKVKNYFPGGNTPQGFYSFYNYLPYQTKKTYIIKGGPGTGKSTFMKRMGKELLDKGYDMEYHWCSSDNNSLDGIVCPQLKVAVFDGTAPHMNDPVNPGAIEEIIYLGEYWDNTKLEDNKKNIIALHHTIKMRFRQVYKYLEAAKLFYDEVKGYYQKAADINKLNNQISEILEKLSPETKFNYNPGRHLFGSAITPNGSVNYFDNLTEDIKTRYILKGNPGSGKSIIIKEIAAQIAKYGYYITHLHCAVEPENLDAVIIPALDTAIINCTPPHAPELIKEKDTVITLDDMLDQQYINHFNNEISDTMQLFNDMMNRAYHYLNLAKDAHDKIEKYYIDAMDFDKLEIRRKKLMQIILT